MKPSVGGGRRLQKVNVEAYHMVFKVVTVFMAISEHSFVEGRQNDG